RKCYVAISTIAAFLVGLFGDGGVLQFFTPAFQIVEQPTAGMSPLRGHSVEEDCRLFVEDNTFADEKILLQDIEQPNTSLKPTKTPQFISSQSFCCLQQTECINRTTLMQLVTSSFVTYGRAIQIRKQQKGVHETAYLQSVLKRTLSKWLKRKRDMKLRVHKLLVFLRHGKLNQGFDKPDLTADIKRVTTAEAAL
ncbi:hypothetical protein C0J52_23537, partial [Blattella germanica]